MLAERLDITPMGIRQHLQSWKNVSWFVTKRAARSAARRATWSLTERGHAFTAADQERLRASALQLFGGAGVEPLLSAREERLYLRYAEELSAERSHQDRLARLVRLRLLLHGWCSTTRTRAAGGKPLPDRRGRLQLQQPVQFRAAAVSPPVRQRLPGRAHRARHFRLTTLCLFDSTTGALEYG
ncbi:hypothetical protein M8494_31760 [Serratia ureilytica]